MKNWKTNLGGLLGFTSVMLYVFNVIDEKQLAIIQSAIITYLGFVGKDSTTTGVGKDAKTNHEIKNQL